jgi:hypothetical protein
MQVDILDKRNDIGLIYSDASIIDNKGKTLFRKSDHFKKRDGNVFEELLLEYDFINWQTVILKRHLFNEVGYFEDYELVEDYDILLRFAEKNKFYGIDKVLASTHVHHTNTGPTRLELKNNISWILNKKIQELNEQIPMKEKWLNHSTIPHQNLYNPLKKHIIELKNRFTENIATLVWYNFTQGYLSKAMREFVISLFKKNFRTNYFIYFIMIKVFKKF